jgi:transcriptional regulator of arginine metabolism
MRNTLAAALRPAHIAKADNPIQRTLRNSMGRNLPRLGLAETYSLAVKPDARPFSKPERQRLIASLVSRRRIGTQHDLLAALASEGCLATQATVSRDIRELGLEKSHDQLGRPRYVLAQDGRRSDPREALASVLSQFGRRATAAQNIVVVHSELGSAPAVARALDRLEHPRIIGTIAGDDTCLAVAGTNRDAALLARELAALVG